MNRSVMNGFAKNRSFMNVICYEHIYYKCGLLWNGLFWTETPKECGEVVEN